MKRILIAAAAIVAAALAGPASAESERLSREQWQQLSQAEKAARKQAARERWKSMSPAEKEAAKAKMRERRAAKQAPDTPQPR